MVLTATSLNPYYTGRYSIRPNSILHYISIYYINITPIHVYFFYKKSYLNRECKVNQNIKERKYKKSKKTKYS